MIKLAKKISWAEQRLAGFVGRNISKTLMAALVKALECLENPY